MNGKGFLLAPIVISKIGLRLSLTHSWAHASAKHMHICTELDHACKTSYKGHRESLLQINLQLIKQSMLIRTSL